MSSYLTNPYEPVAQVGQNMLVYSRSRWMPFVVDYIESMPASSTMTVDYGTIAANGTIAAALAQTLRLDDGYLIEMWMRPIEDVEVILWILQGQQKNRIKNAQARVGLLTGIQDPLYLSSKFYVLGKDLDPYIEIRNPRGYALGATNVSYWGNKYLISKPSADLSTKILSGAVPATRVMAEAKVS